MAGDHARRRETVRRAVRSARSRPAPGPRRPTCRAPDCRLLPPDRRLPGGDDGAGGAVCAVRPRPAPGRAAPLPRPWTWMTHPLRPPAPRAAPRPRRPRRTPRREGRGADDGAGGAVCAVRPRPAPGRSPHHRSRRPRTHPCPPLEERSPRSRQRLRWAPTRARQCVDDDGGGGAGAAADRRSVSSGACPGPSSPRQPPAAPLYQARSPRQRSASRGGSTAPVDCWDRAGPSTWIGR